MNNSTPRITLWALESDNDAKTVKIFAEKILAIANKSVEIHAIGKPDGEIAKKGVEGLKKAVTNFLEQSQCIIFIIDRDGPMSQAQRKQEKNSLINQVDAVVEAFADSGRVHKIIVVNEIEAWLLVDCLGIFCYFAQHAPGLPKACTQDIFSEACRGRLLEKNQSLIGNFSRGDTTTIEEPQSGGKGPKEYLTNFSKEIYKALHKGNRRDKKLKYHERNAPELAEFIKLDKAMIKKNCSLEEFKKHLLQCSSQLN